jgi:hypothetical protein
LNFSKYLLQAAAVAGIYSEHEMIGLESALARYSWKVRASRLLSASTTKPTMEQLLCSEKEVHGPVTS